MALPLIAIPIIDNVVKGVFDIIDKWIPDADAAAKAKQEILLRQMDANKQYLELAAKESEGQTETNKLEAASNNLFASSWRPMLGYVCVLGFAYNFLGYPMLQWWAASHDGAFNIPPLISDNLVELTFGMLGLGMMRTYEKIKGAAR